MPWQPAGTFQRINPDYTSGTNIWQQDQQASIKIIAYRHDIHDQDLADGIAQSLHIGGYNSMAANLKMGGFKISGVGSATLVTDVPLYGQCAGSMDWEFDTGSTLRLLDRNGSVIGSVLIPTAGGGGGITSITASNGLTASPNPIVLSGTISMVDLHTVPTTISGGIATLEYDKYGRVTSATGGAFANTNITIDHNASSVDVNSSTGTDGTINAATGSTAGILTAALYTQIQALIAAGATGMTPPIELIGVNETPEAALGAAVRPWTEQHNKNVDNTGWTSVFEYTGSGVIEYLGIVQDSIATSGLIDLRLTIDGVVVWSALDVFDDGVTADDSGISIIGYVDVTGQLPTVLQQVAFNTSIDLEALSNTSALSNLDAQVKWQKIS